MHRVLNLDVAKAGEQPAVAGVAGGHHAVEHVDAGGDARHQVFRRAHAHQVVRLVGRQTRRHVLQHAHHVFLRLADRQAADGITAKALAARIGVNGLQPSQRFVTQVLEHAALHDAEQRVRVAFSRELVARALCPAQAHAHRGGGFGLSGGAIPDLVRRAFVELHDDVRIQSALDLHGDLGRQEQLVAVDGRGECHAFLGDLAQIAQRKHLKTAGIRQDGFIPAIEAVQALVRIHHFQPRAQPQVEGVAEDDLGADVLQFRRRHRLDRAIRAHRHEDGRFHHAVVQGHAAASGEAIGGEEFVLEHVRRKWNLVRRA